MQFLDRNNAATAAAALRLQEWHVFFTPGLIQTTVGCSDPRENAPLRKELY